MSLAWVLDLPKTYVQSGVVDTHHVITSLFMQFLFNS